MHATGTGVLSGRGRRSRWSHARLGGALGGLEQQGVDERLGEVAAQLALDDVVLLGEQAGLSQGAAVALEPAHRAGDVALVEGGQREVEPAQHEAPSASCTGGRVLPEPVDVAVVGEVLDDPAHRRDLAGDAGVRDGTPVSTRAASTEGSSGERASVRRGAGSRGPPRRRVGRRARPRPPRSAPSAAPAARSPAARSAGSVPSAGPRAPRRPRRARRAGPRRSPRGTRRTPAVAVEPPGPVRRGQQQQGLTERVELELGVPWLPRAPGPRGNRAAGRGARRGPGRR